MEGLLVRHVRYKMEKWNYRNSPVHICLPELAETKASCIQGVGKNEL